MGNRRRMIIHTSLIGIIIIGLTALVWGKTWRTAQVNRLLLQGKYDSAVTGYQRLLTGASDAPVLLNNLGLCLYRQGKYDAAAGYFRKALKAASGRPDQARQSQLLNNIHYHLGNSLFKLAAGRQPDQAYNLFNEALSNYRQAIEAARPDREAKYNYELTRLRVDQARQQQQQPQDKPDQPNPPKKQDDRGKQPEQSRPDQRQNPAGDRNNQPKQRQEQARQSGQPPKKQSQGTMSKAEAEALLNAAEHGDQYQGRMIIEDTPDGAKDW